MPAVLPSVYGHSAISPLKQNVTYANEITRFENGSEQRIVTRRPLNTFVLRYENISRADRQALSDFVSALRGSYDTSWTFDLRADTTVRPYNGNFALGGKGWTFFDPTNSFNPLYTNRGFSRSGECNALATNKPHTFPPGQLIQVEIQSQSFPVAAGQPLNFRFLVAVVTGSAWSSVLFARASLFITVFDAGGNYLAVQGGLSATVGPSNGWRKVSEEMVVAPSNAASAKVILVGTITNTGSSPFTLSNNQLAFAFGEVRGFVTGEVGLYPSCTFEDDDFSWTETSVGQWSGSIKFRQTNPGGQWPSGTLTAFPGFGPNSQLVTGYPFIYSDHYDVDKNDLSTGRRISYYYNGQPGFPSRALRSWTLTLSTLSDPEIVRLQQHYLAASGSWRTFGFTDPDTAKTYGRVRYDSDSLEITRLQPNLSSAIVKLAEVYSSNWVA